MTLQFISGWTKTPKNLKLWAGFNGFAGKGRDMSLLQNLKIFYDAVALTVGTMLSEPRETIAPESRLTRTATDALVAHSKKDLGSDEAKVGIAERDGVPVYIMGWVKAPSPDRSSVAVKISDTGHAWWCRADSLENALENHTEWTSRFSTDHLDTAWDEDDARMLASARESLNKVLPTAKGIAMILRQYSRQAFGPQPVKFGHEMNK